MWLNLPTIPTIQTNDINKRGQHLVLECSARVLFGAVWGELRVLRRLGPSA